MLFGYGHSEQLFTAAAWMTAIIRNWVEIAKPTRAIGARVGSEPLDLQLPWPVLDDN
jgi:hypothetical protein